MSEKKYVIGIDFGTLSGRALVLDTSNGKELGEAVFEYPHAVMEKELPCGVSLAPQFALQHPRDYLETISNIIPRALKESGISSDEVAAVSIDFTTSTVIPVYNDGTPLCFDEKFKCDPHAYVKLWKHHAAQPQADKINELAAQRGENWHARYGGKISCEWFFPKILQILEEAPYIYDATDRFIEAGDWMAWMLTGKESHSAAYAGYKAMWSQDGGYPSAEFFEALDVRMKNIIGTKVSTELSYYDKPVGYVDERGAKLTGLAVGTPVGVSMPDAHTGMVSMNITDNGTLMLVLGTSACHIINSDTKNDFKGMCGYVKDSICKGHYTYEAGQSCLGDGYDRFVKKFVPENYMAEARERGINIHKLLREKAKELSVGESGLLCLDWFNGNRSILEDADLSGVILGLRLDTTPEAIYRSLIEASAFGTRVIIENFEKNGIVIDSICAAGGISRKDEMMMQIFADVTGREIKITGSTQTAARGSAIYASVAGGIFKTLPEAAQALSLPDVGAYSPIKKNHEIYNELYSEYKKLHDYFGRGENNVLKKLMYLNKH